MTLAIYGIGYIARMTRASMVEVMTQQYIRTARLKGLSFSSVVVKHALRNALIAPFTVIMLQFPWLLTGVVIVEVMFRYQGFGYTLVEAAGNNDIDLLLGCSLVSVFIVLITQLISDVGYALSQSAHQGSVEGDGACRSQYIGAFTIVLEVLSRFWPVWVALAIVHGRELRLQEEAGLYGQLFDSGVGIAGVVICLFWLFTAIFASTISPFDPLGQIPIMKDALPGAIEPQSGLVYLFGGDKLARDVFSRMVYGSQIVLIIAPAATGFALMVGITLGLPAGYYGGKIDTVLSFLANLVLAFPVILLFYLLVTPGIMDTPIPYAHGRRLLPVSDHLLQRAVLDALQEPAGPDLHPARPDAGHRRLDLCSAWSSTRTRCSIVHIDPNQLNIFVAVVFASSPGVFRIVRGLVMDIKTRDYVAAAQTRGEIALVHHAVGNPAQCARAADRRCLPAHRLHHHPARHARLFRPGPGAGEPGLGHGDQGCQPAAALLHPPGAAADDRADVVRAGPQPARRLAARTIDEGLIGGLSARRAW